MTGPVICGVDFSDDSRRALRWAQFMAQRLEQPLVVVHAIEPLLVSAATLEYGPDVLRATLDAELDGFISRTLGRPANVRVELGTGEAAGIIRGTALASGASLVVVGTQGLGQVGRLWFGSTTTRVLRESAQPVLAIPPGAAARSDGDLRVAEIIVGTDFGRAARAAIETAQALSLVFDAPVTSLHAVPAVPAVPAPDRWTGALTQAVEMVLRDARAQLGTTVPAGWTSDVRTGNPARVLVEASAGRDALIVVGLGGTQPGQRPGTTAYRVLCDADSPVLAVPAR